MIDDILDALSALLSAVVFTVCLFLVLVYLAIVALTMPLWGIPYLIYKRRRGEEL